MNSLAQEVLSEIKFGFVERIRSYGFEKRLGELLQACHSSRRVGLLLVVHVIDKFLPGNSCSLWGIPNAEYDEEEGFNLNHNKLEDVAIALLSRVRQRTGFAVQGRLNEKLIQSGYVVFSSELTDD